MASFEARLGRPYARDFKIRDLILICEGELNLRRRLVVVEVERSEPGRRRGRLWRASLGTRCPPLQAGAIENFFNSG